jgi:processive 1,2-diacylglycerol beta-glucosyltransferase
MCAVKEDRLPERTIILTASVGAGHHRAAEAVRAALLAEPSDGSRGEQPRIVDVLEHANPLFRLAYRDGYLALVRRMPSLVGGLYERSDRARPAASLRRRRRLLLAAGAGGIARFLRRERPESIVCTHFLASAIAAHLIDVGAIDARLSVVVTDVDAHAVWLAEPCDRYFVASDLAGKRLVALGAAPGRIVRTGIPIDPAFARPIERAEARASLGLPARGAVVLVTGGGVGVGPLVEIVEDLLAAAAAGGRPRTIVAVAGRNAKAEAALRALEGRGSLVVHGYTTRMRELMAAADLLVGKPGGLTSSEALASGLPLVVVSPVPGQEDRNADHLLELGVAVRCRDRSSVAWKVDWLLDDPTRLAAMRRRARAAARPDAARLVARGVRALEPASAERLAIPFTPLTA